MPERKIIKWRNNHKKSMKKIVFNTPTLMSLMDITTMGGSEKLGDITKIGQFCSGLKYAIALLLRAKVEINIETYSSSGKTEHFYFDTFVKRCKETGKSKELIRVHRVTDGEREEFVTGFAKELGYNWELWMAFRELYSNMLDENGNMGGEAYPEGTKIELLFNEGSDFDSVMQNKSDYINVNEPDFIVSEKLSLFKNEQEGLRIYKNNILVYENKDHNSMFSYNINFGQIDERRLLNDVGDIRKSIISKLLSCEDRGLVKQLVRENDFIGEKEWLKGYYGGYESPSETYMEIAKEAHKENGKYFTFEWVSSKLKARKDYTLPGRKIESIGDSLWNYYKTVTIESTPTEIENKITEVSITDEIKNGFRLEFNCIIKTAVLKGSKVIADKYNKTLIISEDFTVKNDMAEFIVQYFYLIDERNVIETMSEKLVELLKQ